jgi:hypothetical protein
LRVVEVVVLREPDEVRVGRSELAHELEQRHHRSPAAAGIGVVDVVLGAQELFHARGEAMVDHEVQLDPARACVHRVAKGPERHVLAEPRGAHLVPPAVRDAFDHQQPLQLAH